MNLKEFVTYLRNNDDNIWSIREKFYDNFKNLEDQEENEDVAWIIKESESCPIAECVLGWLYRFGFGVKDDVDEAIRLYKNSASRGYKTAYYNIADIYANSPLYNPVECIKWQKKSALEGNNIESQYDLGCIYEFGDVGPDKDEEEAFKWYKMSADQGHDEAQDALGRMYMDGTTPIGKDYNEAIKWTKKAYEQGNCCSMTRLGVMYGYGYGVEKNLDEAIRFFKEAKENNCDLALVMGNSELLSILPELKMIVGEKASV